MTIKSHYFQRGLGLMEEDKWLDSKYYLTEYAVYFNLKSNFTNIKPISWSSFQSRSEDSVVWWNF